MRGREGGWVREGRDDTAAKLEGGAYQWIHGHISTSTGPQLREYESEERGKGRSEKTQPNLGGRRCIQIMRGKP